MTGREIQRQHPQMPHRPCPAPLAEWTVLVYKANHSAFSGYARTRSSYSQLECDRCGFIWRSKAAYVESVKLSAREKSYR